jgi:hypothetical protein
MISHFLQQEAISNQTTVFFSFVALANPQRQAFEQGDQMIFFQKVAQYVAKPIFCQKCYLTVYKCKNMGH